MIRPMMREYGYQVRYPKEGKSLVVDMRAPLGGRPARDKVFAVAADLFHRKGIRAVGVEEIVNEADVAKISLYRNFASMDDLVVTYLEGRNAGGKFGGPGPLAAPSGMHRTRFWSTNGLMSSCDIEPIFCTIFQRGIRPSSSGS